MENEVIKASGEDADPPTHVIFDLPGTEVWVRTFVGDEELDLCPVGHDGCQDGCYSAENVRNGVTWEISDAVRAGKFSGFFGPVRWETVLKNKERGRAPFNPGKHFRSPAHALGYARHHADGSSDEETIKNVMNIVSTYLNSGNYEFALDLLRLMESREKSGERSGGCQGCGLLDLDGDEDELPCPCGAAEALTVNLLECSRSIETSPAGIRVWLAGEVASAPCDTYFKRCLTKALESDKAVGVLFALLFTWDEGIQHVHGPAQEWFENFFRDNVGRAD